MKESFGTPEFRLWLTIVGAATLVLGASYSMIQQSTRLAANDLPIATAQTVRHQLETGSDAKDVIPTIKTDLKNDSTLFVTITDHSTHILASNADLNGKPSLPPQGVFDFTKSNGSDNITWQPQKGVRLATHTETYKNGNDIGFIVTGQSLKQAEDRINTYSVIALTAWIAVLIWTSATLLWNAPKLKTSKSKTV